MYLLGRFEAVLGDAAIPAGAWRRRRPADLLKLVLLTPGRRLTREQAIDTLWPEKDAASGANNLHRALYDLRQILGGRWVDIERGEVRVRPGIWLDVDAFESAVSAGDKASLETAVALYRGDLSPEDPGSPWLAARRGALRQRFAEAAFPLADDAATRGDSALAVPLLRRVVDVEPAHEPAHRLLMRLYAEHGRRADALRQYDACAVALRSLASRSPSEPTDQLRDAIQRGEIGRREPKPVLDHWRRAARRLLGTTEPPTLRGRAGVMSLFEKLVERGAGALVLLGERGVGKTRLAVEGARLAQNAGAVVLAGRASADVMVPHGPFAAAWRDFAEAAALPGGDPFESIAMLPLSVSHERRKQVLLERVCASVQEIGGGRPVYVLVDDVHVADESTLNLFHFLAHGACSTKVMLVATCREDAIHAGTPVQTFLAHLDCDRLARGVRVQRLDLEATREQLADLGGSPPSRDVAEQVYRITDGNPLQTEELVSVHGELVHGPLPADPGAAMRVRLARLGPKAEALLAAAAAAGDRFELEVVRHATELNAHDALAALDQCLEARLVEEDGTGGHRFHHTLIRERIYDALTPERRAALHQAIADAVEARAATTNGGLESSAELLAHHRQASAEPLRAVPHLLAAGRRAIARGGLQEALRSFGDAERLLAKAEASGPERLSLLEALGDVQLAIADLGGLGRSLDTAADLRTPEGWMPSSSERARTRRVTALGQLVGGHVEDARQQLEVALGHAMAGHGDERAEILLLLSQLAWHTGRHPDAVEFAERAGAEAEHVGDARLGGAARELAALARIAMGQPAPEPAPLPTGADAAPPEAYDLHLVLWERELLGDKPFADVAEQVKRYGERARLRGDAAALATANAVEGALALEAGRWDEAERLLRDAAEGHQRSGSAFAEAFALERLGVLLTARGRHDEAISVLASGLLVAERADLRLHALTRLHAAMARNRLALGDVDAAESYLREALQSAARHGDCLVCETLFRRESVRVALARGHVTEAGAEAIELEALAERPGGRALLALAKLARGRVLAAQARAADARRALEESRWAWASIGANYEAARALLFMARTMKSSAQGPEQQAEAERLAAEASQALSSIGVAAAES